MAPRMTSAGVALIWPAPALDRDGLLRAFAELASDASRREAEQSNDGCGETKHGPCSSVLHRQGPEHRALPAGLRPVCDGVYAERHLNEPVRGGFYDARNLAAVGRAVSVDRGYALPAPGRGQAPRDLLVESGEQRVSTGIPRCIRELEGEKIVSLSDRRSGLRAGDRPQQIRRHFRSDEKRRAIDDLVAIERAFQDLAFLGRLCRRTGRNAYRPEGEQRERGPHRSDRTPEEAAPACRVRLSDGTGSGSGIEVELEFPPRICFTGNAPGAVSVQAL
jgi:hypothetical protein